MLEQFIKLMNENKKHILVMCSFFIFFSFFQTNNETFAHQSETYAAALHQDANLLNHEIVNTNKKSKVSSDLLDVIIFESNSIQQKYTFAFMVLLFLSFAHFLRSQNSRYISNLPPPALA